MMYSILILYYRAAWIQLKPMRFDKSYEPVTHVSILIPARNEASHIPDLLRDLSAQYYPAKLMEIIVIDDHSTDETARLAKSFPGVRCISLADYLSAAPRNAYKKKALETGIQQSKGELILTTDADCRIGPYWLPAIVQFYETEKPVFIASPVLFTHQGSLLDLFQSLDFMTMQGITAAVIETRTGTMCNGANLAYTRRAFDAVDGFKDIDQIASGDDMLLMQKIEQRFPGRCRYLKSKEALVLTYPMPGWKQFLQQRIRWASKAPYYRDRRIQVVLLLVYLLNLLFPLLLLAGIFYSPGFLYFWILLGIKTILELTLLYPISIFFKRSFELWWFPVLQFLHIPYILYAGWMGRKKKYIWKDREVH